jgi:hypothetical protein
MRASGRSRTKSAKAASMSLLLLVLKAWIRNRVPCAAASTSRNVDAVPSELPGSTSTATRVAPGTSSSRSSSRLQPVWIAVGRCEVEKSNHRYCGLPCVRSERPRSRAAEERDELASSHVLPSNRRYTVEKAALCITAVG